jgi:hypothetical protein
MIDPNTALLDGPGTASSLRRARWPGIAVLMAVAVIVLTMPPVDGRRVAGLPVPITLPGPPSIGTCLQPVASAASSAEFPRFGSCDSGTALGEVIAVRFRDAGASSEPAEEDCTAAIAEYAGLSVMATGFRPHNSVVNRELPWQVPFRPARQWVRQAPMLPHATSAWDACVASPPTTWQVGSLAGAFAGGHLPAGYGRCWVARNPEPRDAVIACAWPHTAELVGVVSGPGTDDAGLVDRSCRRLAADLLARTDPTVNGALVVRADWGDPLDDHAATTAYCYVATADDRLVEGSFVGLGESAISYFGS